MKFQRFCVKELLFYNHIEAFFENFHQKWKNASCGAQFSYFFPNQVSKKSFYTFEDINLRESYAKFLKDRVKLWELIEFKG